MDRGRILLIGGGEDTKALLKELAREEGYEVLLVPPSSWARLFKYNPDLAIIDAGMEGWDICRRIKGFGERIPTKILIVSDREEVGDRIQAYRIGAEGVLARPLEKEDLFQRVRDLVKKEAGTRPAYVQEEGIKGSLKDMGLPDLLQVLNMGQKTALIYLTNGQEEGRVFMEKGEVVHGVYGPYEGEEAIYQLLKWEDGRFEIEPDVSSPVRTVGLSVEELLLEGMKRMDEEREGKVSEGEPKKVEPESFNLIKKLYELGILEKKE